MNEIMISNTCMIVKSVASISSSVSRIVDSNNNKRISLNKINNHTRLACKKIELQSKSDRDDIDFYKKNITLAINSNKLNSRQKKEVFLTNIDAIEKI